MSNLRCLLVMPTAQALLVVAWVLVSGHAFSVVGPRLTQLRSPAVPLRRFASTVAQQQAEQVLSLGAPRFCPPNGTYVTAGGVGVTRGVTVVPREDVEARVEVRVLSSSSRGGGGVRVSIFGARGSPCLRRA